MLMDAASASCSLRKRAPDVAFAELLFSVDRAGLATGLIGGASSAGTHQAEPRLVHLRLQVVNHLLEHRIRHPPNAGALIAVPLVETVRVRGARDGTRRAAVPEERGGKPATQETQDDRRPGVAQPPPGPMRPEARVEDP